jgi:hypothetical protein
MFDVMVLPACQPPELCASSDTAQMRLSALCAAFCAVYVMFAYV